MSKPWLLAPVSFVLALFLTLHFINRQREAAELQPTREPAGVALPASSGTPVARTSQQPLPPPPGFTPLSGLTRWQRILYREPDAASQTQFAVRRAMLRARREQDRRPADCLADADLIGEFRMRVAVFIRSTERTIEVLDWQFAELIEGSPLEADVVSCIESQLVNPGIIEAKAPIRFLDGYEGPISIRLAARIGASDQLPPR